MPYLGKIEAIAARRRQTGQQMMHRLLIDYHYDFEAIARELRVHPRTVERYVNRYFECVFQPKPDVIDADVVSEV